MGLAPFRKPHLTEALHWSVEPVEGRSLVVAALGMMVPVLVGLAFGHLETGFTIGLGAMLLSEAPAPANVPGASGRPSPLSALLPAIVAVTVATLISGAGAWTDVALILLAGVAATLSGYSRPLGVATIRFIIYLVLSVTLLQSAGDHRSGAALIFGLGALWNIIIRQLLAGPRREPLQADPKPPARQPTPAQRRSYFRRTLRTLEGWQFPIRIVAGLAAASVLRQLWPGHHFGWIVLTVALLTQRPIEHLPVKTIQRALGVTLGVALTFAIVVWTPPQIALAILICGLAIAAAVARSRNYLAYSAISTPVILLVLDFGRPVQTSLLTDRLVATVLGAAIVIGANVALDWATRRTSSNTIKTAG